MWLHTTFPKRLRAATRWRGPLSGLIKEHGPELEGVSIQGFMASLTIRKSKTLRPSRLERLLVSLAVKRWGLFKVRPACHVLNTYFAILGNWRRLHCLQIFAERRCHLRRISPKILLFMTRFQTWSLSNHYRWSAGGCDKNAQLYRVAQHKGWLLPS